MKGRIARLAGTITFDEADRERSAAAVEFDAASIDTRSDQRDQHLRSAVVLPPFLEPQRERIVANLKPLD